MKGRKRRSDAYFGLHFDFHAVAETKNIGAYTDAEDIGKWLDEVKPDYIQIDTKGHPGYCSYRSACGGVAPGLVVDHLKIIREETAKRGIALIAHHSGIWDKLVAREHPEWQSVDIHGKPLDGQMGMLSPYVDEYLIPRLLELAEKYDFDGAWVDGDNWWLREAHDEAYLKEFYRRSGYDHVDPDPLSPSRMAYRMYLKDELDRYYKHYMSAVHARFPEFEITSNAAYDMIDPREPIEDIDFLSNDVNGFEYRMRSRCCASHDKPWDIMRWGAPSCTNNAGGGFIPTGNCHVSRIERVAAITVSLGGGFEVVNGMTEQGKIRSFERENMKEVSRFLMERKPFNYKSRPLANAALFKSVYDHDMQIAEIVREKDNNALISGLELDYGMCDVVVDGGRPIDVIYEYKVLRGEFGDRETVILPEIKHMRPETKAALLGFAEKGGNLVICGADCCKLFLDLVPGTAKDVADRGIYVSAKSSPNYGFAIKRAVCFEDCGEELCTTYLDALDESSEKVKTSFVRPYGKGRLAFVGFDVFRAYTAHFYSDTAQQSFVARDIMRDVLDLVEPCPRAYLESGIRNAEIIPAEKDGALLVNVINTADYYTDFALFPQSTMQAAEFPPLCDLSIAVRSEKKPKSVTLEPGGRKADYTYDGKYLHVKLDRLPIHEIIRVI